ncbi:MAG: HAD-IC family P-type ATPase, partial [Desulfobacca sp.]|uniref:HAD-IC family P-type ATPase n=1 Tax=Desulfobacca sp. TaxID=2067990 RepID=UPI00404B3922
MIQAIHTAVEGRARFKIDGLYRSEAMQRFLEAQAVRGNGNGIKAVSANPLTGNALIHFDEGVDPETVGRWLSQVVGEFQEVQATAQTSAASPGQENGAAHRSSQAGEAGPQRLALSSAYEEQPGQPWHTLEAEEVLAAWSTSASTGLSAAVVAVRTKRYGPNALPEGQVRSQWEIFLEQFQSLPVALLGGAAGLSVLTGGVLEAVLILGVVVANAYLAYKTESAAETTIRSLQQLVKPTAAVVRQGSLREIAVDEVVPGDLLAFKPGTYVAADCRLIAVDRLSVDEAALTGESLPVTKGTATLTSVHVPLADRSNMVYRGTMVTGGQGFGVAPGHHG